MKHLRGILVHAYDFADDVMQRSADLARDVRPRVHPDHEQVQKALDALNESAKSLRRWASIALGEEIKQAMRDLYDEERHETATELAEETADELEIEDVLDDEDHPIWDWAIEVMDEVQEEEEDEDQ